MNEGQKALKAIRFWMMLFVLLFAIYGFFTTAMHIEIVNQIRAYNSCEGVEDKDFNACYTKALNR